MPDLMIINPTDNTLLLTFSEGGKDTRSRLKRYVAYLDQYNLVWWKPDLKAYRNHLRSGRLAESSIAAHLSTIRGRYRAVIRQRDLFYQLLPPTPSPADAAAIVNEVITRIENALHPDEAKTQVVVKQDVTDREKTWLTPAQIIMLLKEPQRVHGNAPPAWRDTAILGLAISTGIREDELSSLNIGDLFHAKNDEPCLLVRQGKGNKQRIVPYGELTLGLELTQKWLRYLKSEHGIADEDQPVFWSFWKGYKTLRSRLSNRRIDEIARSYFVPAGDQFLTVSMHDFRRTYARLQYQAGMPLLEISHNLGHTSIEVTRGYIGDVSVEARRGRSFLNLKGQSPG